MDWYLQKDSDLIVPNEQEAFEAPWAGDENPLPSDWYHWGFIRPDRLKSPSIYGKSSEEDFDFDNQVLYDQVSKRPSGPEGEVSSSSACGQQPPVDCDARALEASVYGQTDFQLQNSMDWMDDIFLNSLLEVDHGSMENSLQSLYMPDNICKSLSVENSLTNVFIDPQSLMKDPGRREASMPTWGIPLLKKDISELWEKTEDSSSSMLEESKRSEGSATVPDLTVLVPAEVSASNASEGIADVEEPECLGATVLQELEDIMINVNVTPWGLNDEMRICFRDALYRLAKNSKEQNTISQSRNADFIDGPSFVEVNSESPSMGRSQRGESKTNVIDRTIANLMFNQPYYHNPHFPHPGSLHYSAENFASSGSYYSLEQTVPPHYHQDPT